MSNKVKKTGTENRNHDKPNGDTLDDSDWANNPALYTDYAGPDQIIDGEHSGSWDSDLSEDDIALALMAFEEDDDGSHQRSEEPVHTAIGDIPDPRDRRRTTNLITDEDFEEGVERQTFIYTREWVRLIVTEAGTPADKAEALQWVFDTNPLNHTDITFDLCCQGLGARADVLRFRIQFELWRKWIVLSSPLTFRIALPTILANDIRYLVGTPGMWLAIAAYRHPGVTADELFQSSSALQGFKETEQTRSEMRKLLAVMEERRMVSSRGDNWYLTGRNPLVMTTAQLITGAAAATRGYSWSALWPEEDY